MQDSTKVESKEEDSEMVDPQDLSNETNKVLEENGDVKEDSPTPENDVTKKNNAKQRNSKKDRNVEQQILRSLHAYKTPEEKLSALCKKYFEVTEENQVSQNALKQSQLKFQALQREKNQLQVDHSKAVLTRSRLESLCRELQKQNKAVQEESIKKIKEEEEKRKEVSQKFQTTLAEIHNLMEASNQKNSKLRDENQDLGKKLKGLIEQYDAREKHVEQVLQHREMQTQLAETKLAKANMELAAEKEQNLLEKKKLLEDLTDYQQKCQSYAGTEIKLRTELNMYMEKYEEFQAALSKSNEVFTSFRAEMDKMTKKIKKLEIETASWRTKWESSNKALLKMAEDKQRMDGSYLTAQKRVAQLDKLCRAMQVERTKLLQLLKEYQTKDSEASTISGDLASLPLEPPQNGGDGDIPPSYESSQSQNTEQDPSPAITTATSISEPTDPPKTSEEPAQNEPPTEANKLVVS